MLSKSQIKLYKSLEKKKFRNETLLFVAEGTKTVNEFIENNWEIEALIATEEWAKKYSKKSINKLIITHYEEIQKLSFQKTPQEVIAIIRQKEYKKINPLNKLGIALDNIQDSGNVGTIIRTALWFGLDYLFFGNGTADIFSPKVVQASMGAIAKIAFNKGDLASFLSSSDTNTTIYGTFMEGDNIFQTKLKQNGILIMGNEGNGISPTIERFINKRLYIPPFPNQKAPIDSLNVATAAAIICAEFRRNNFFI